MAEAEQDIQALIKENRILRKKLERSIQSQAKLEDVNRKKETLLKRVIDELQASQAVLENKRSDLQAAIDQLQRAQTQLVETGKMAALGNLVAGVAHEINTPVGTSITLVSTLLDETNLLSAAIASGQLKRSELTAYIEVAQECTTLLLTNLNRAAELVQSFKQVAADQTRLEHRNFSVKTYLVDVAISLSPRLKHTAHKLMIYGDEAICIDSYPGALAQILTNLVTNSLLHAFPEQPGHISVRVRTQGDRVHIEYHDDGCGIPAAHLSKIFEPFFTTARQHGGTGLGLPIVYNLVTQKLKGAISVESHPGQGSTFLISLPHAITPDGP